MNTISHLMQGKKTYAGIIITVIGLLGVSQYITGAEVAQTYDLILQFAGIVLTVYGRVATKAK